MYYVQCLSKPVSARRELLHNRKRLKRSAKGRDGEAGRIHAVAAPVKEL